jgi:curved DNA-binding protein CbpA
MDLNSKLFDSIRTRPKRGEEPKVKAVVTCQWTDCGKPATHKAPAGRMREGEFFNFCVDHVRHYNKSFNYFSGLNDSEIAKFQKEAITGHRPTWKAGVNAASKEGADAATRWGRANPRAKMRDPFGLFNDGKPGATPQERKLKQLEGKAFETLGLGANATGEAIKARYKELVKQHHPDANGGDRSSEDRLRDVIQAYKLLRQAGFCT